MRLNKICEETALFTLVISALVLGGAVPTGYLISANDSNQTLAQLKTQGDGYVDMRINSLSAVEERLSKNTELSTSITAQLQSNINIDLAKLLKLRNAIDSATTKSAVHDSTQEIFTTLRIYLLVLPSKNLVVSADKLRHEANMMLGKQQDFQAQVAALQATNPGLASKIKPMVAAFGQQAATGRDDASKEIKEAIQLRAIDYDNNNKILIPLFNEQAANERRLKQAYSLEQQINQELTSGKATPKPNIIFILTDDMDSSLTQYMPNTTKLIADRGATFTNYFDDVSLCCSARTTILRGQYAHNTSIYGNYPPLGGFYAFYNKGLENSTIGSWLRSGQYDTALMGKYLNGYPNPDGLLPNIKKSYIPPGWSDWSVPVGGDPYGEYNYILNNNGTVDKSPHKRSDPHSYLVDVTSDHADSFISQPHPNGYFAYVASYAPHAPYTYAPRFKNEFSSVTYPNKPNRTGLPAGEKAHFDDNYRSRIRAVQAVDQMVQRLYNEVKARGELNNTYFVFTSDNGYHMGEHGLGAGKNTMYNEDIHIPLYIAGPGIKAGTVVSNSVGNIDLAPTFADIANVSTPSFVDGRSLLPLAEGATIRNWPDFMITERTDYDTNQKMQPQNMNATNGTSEKGTLEPADSPDQVGTKKVVPYKGIRSANYLYVEYGNGQKVLFNEKADPFELHNLLSNTKRPQASSSLVDMLSRQLHEYENCSGVTCSE